MNTERKRKSKLKHTLTIIFLMISLIGIISISSRVTTFVDAPSLVLIILLTCPILILADSFGDFIRGYKIAAGNLEYTLKELKASKNAVDLCIKLVYISSVIGVITGFISILQYLDDPSSIGPSIAVCILTIFYAFVINLVQHGVSAKIAKEIIYREQ
ncbi:hypothetical protein R9X47_15465 [Wukongibacter baidiensis]|uniref:hypothetical protein n=1 Tax=Wukongibacter baidiensis TaxID=1723361 RepID=UPI003D7FB606